MALSISFKGKRVLITGAARGLGRDLVSTLTEHEAIIFAISRNPANLEKLKTDFPNITTKAVDVSDWKATKEAVESLGPIDLLINNAGVAFEEPFLNITEEHFDAVMDTNVKSVVNISQVVAKSMIQRGQGGSIVNVSSMGAKVYMRLSSAYCASKAALDMFTKSMAFELGPHGIRVNSVNPTIFQTDMTKQFLEEFPGGGEYFQKRCPLGRIAESQEVVNTILFLLSDAAPMIHGETVLVDGGYCIA